MAYCLDCQRRVVNFVHYIEDAQGWEGNEDEDNGREDCSNCLYFLSVYRAGMSEFSGEYKCNDVED